MNLNDANAAYDEAKSLIGQETFLCYKEGYTPEQAVEHLRQRGLESWDVVKIRSVYNDIQVSHEKWFGEIKATPQ